MPEFSKNKIYKIVNDINKKFYIGRTIQKLSYRMATHRTLHSTCMCKNLGIDLKECSIILVENYPCNNIDEARKRERFYIEKYRDEGLEIVNKNIPGRTRKEWRKDNPKKYQEQNNRNNTKTKIKEKKRRQENPEKYKKKDKIVYEKRKHKLQEKITCECGDIISKGCLSRHKKRQPHIVKMFLKDIEQSNFYTN